MMEENIVAPHVGAWIETQEQKQDDSFAEVAPHVGAWIETFPKFRYPKSLIVAPHVGAWIETSLVMSPPVSARSRAPRGRVD